jgi:hypothetical protein
MISPYWVSCSHWGLFPIHIEGAHGTEWWAIAALETYDSKYLHGG